MSGKLEMKARRARDRWEAACPIAFVVMLLAAIFWPLLGAWPALLAVVVFLTCNVGFFYWDWKLESARHDECRRRAALLPTEGK